MSRKFSHPTENEFLIEEREDAKQRNRRCDMEIGIVSHEDWEQGIAGLNRSEREEYLFLLDNWKEEPPPIGSDYQRGRAELMYILNQLTIYRTANLQEFYFMQKLSPLRLPYI